MIDVTKLYLFLESDQVLINAPYKSARMSAYTYRRVSMPVLPLSCRKCIGPAIKGVGEMTKPPLLRTSKTFASLHGLQLPPTEELISQPGTEYNTILYSLPESDATGHSTSAETEGSKRREASLPTIRHG